MASELARGPYPGPGAESRTILMFMPTSAPGGLWRKHDCLRGADSAAVCVERLHDVRLARLAQIPLHRALGGGAGELGIAFF